MIRKDENNNCKHAGDMAAYIYGEQDFAESAKFEGHLSLCGECRSEMAGLSMVHASVADWKAAEFSALPTPQINIPYDRPSEKRSGWLDGIAAAFGGRALWAGGSFAALVAAAGLAWFALTPPPSVEKASADPVSQIAAPAPKEEVALPQLVQPVSEPETSAGTEKTAKRSTRVPARQLTADNKSAPKKNTRTRRPQPTDRPAPAATALTLDEFDEIEDESLRLSDMFAQSDPLE